MPKKDRKVVNDNDNDKDKYIYFEAYGKRIHIMGPRKYPTPYNIRTRAKKAYTHTQSRTCTPTHR